MPNFTSERSNSIPKEVQLIERVVERENLKKAYSRVMRNKGAAGVDKMTTAELKPYLKENWRNIKVKLLAGEYQPKAVRKVEIPKPGGGVRELGVPTVVDRLIQQALHQVLSPIFDPDFSDSSYGFRPGRSAHEAIRAAKRYQLEGKRWVVDMDLARFFDEVNHDILMSRVARKVKDKKVLVLIRRYLQAGIMENGVTTAREKGTPQGGPLSPLLSNILLDDQDKELERRGHSFCRYADDCNVYVKTQRAAERVLESLTQFVERKLKLKVNRKKSAVGRSSQRTFLGYSFTFQPEAKIRVPAETIRKLKAKLKPLLRKGRGRNIGKFIQYDLNPVLRGWINYFSLAEVNRFAERLDSWIRRRLRLILWRQWKRPWTRRNKLMALGLREEHAVMTAFNGRGPWYCSGSPMHVASPKSYFETLGLVSTLDELCRLRVFNYRNRLGT